MKTTTVLFDLDGTLLPMDQDIFVKTYFGLLAKRIAPLGYEPEKLVGAIWSGTAAMVKNTGDKTNEEVFWDKFCEIFGEDARKDEPHFAEFYTEDFDKVQISCGFTPDAARVISLLKSKGYRVALATNPIFPSIATEKRIAWAGLKPSDFEYFTAYENSRHCKPNPEYYSDVTRVLGVDSRECLMIGNDVTEDMVAETLGMKTFLLTDCIINKESKDISVYPHGNFDNLIEFIKNTL